MACDVALELPCVSLPPVKYAHKYLSSYVYMKILNSSDIYTYVHNY